MRARDIMLYSICIAIAAPLITMTEIFGIGAAGMGAEYVKNAFIVAGAGGVIVILAAGGVSIMGFNFKLPAVLTSFLAIYVFCVGLIETLTIQMIMGIGTEYAWEIAAIFSGVFLALFAVIGYFAALEIAGGAHGPFE